MELLPVPYHLTSKDKKYYKLIIFAISGSPAIPFIWTKHLTAEKAAEGKIKVEATFGNTPIIVKTLKPTLDQ